MNIWKSGLFRFLTADMIGHPDPHGRHEHRYSDGTHWTEHVADGRTRAVDPL